ncbi:unnamed protein product [Orchesella dallaii]|uniref:Vitelline membrane outer layer protein 1 n=1 Tax=Orchesella dallaii TaxID=48710 RepID=A0ABP1RJC6_9HEXA
MAFKYSFLILLAFSLSASAENLNITSQLVTNWGEWGAFQKCPDNRTAQGFQLRTESYQGLLWDDTALNGIRLYCGDPFNDTTPILNSTVGPNGDWGSTFSCYPGSINGFQLRVEPYMGSSDDTATNNARFFCSNAPDPNQYVEGDGLEFGSWSETRRCFTNQAVCGFQTQVEDCDSTDDCTGLNNILAECCDRFQLKTETYRYIDGDDTALNSIKLFCGDPTRQTTPIITSSQGHYGRWGKIYSCYPDFLRGFRMRVMLQNFERCGDGDNFAATNIRFYCNNGKILEGDGLNFGEWGEAQLCQMKQAVCGIQTQVEGVQVKADDTALNNVLMECCDLSPDRKAPIIPTQKQEIEVEPEDNKETC